MESLVETYSEIEVVLGKAQENYSEAHKLGGEKIITESLASYLKELVNMRSCLDIARLFANERLAQETELRLLEASTVLKEISRVYRHPSQYNVKHRLADIARDEFKEAYQDCKRLLEERN